MYLWTDPKVTLSWIKAIDKEFKTFVENRLREICNNTDWSYSPTEFNPADVITRVPRVEMTKNIIENKLWWDGPEFLELRKEQRFEFSMPENNFDTEVRKTSSTCLSLNDKKLTSNMNNKIYFNRYRNYDKVLRIIAWILCFICNLRSAKTQKAINESILKPKELKHGVIILNRNNKSVFVYLKIY